MTNTKTSRGLVPGTLEKIESRCKYGCPDTVFVGGQAYGCVAVELHHGQSFARGIEYAHARGVDVHVASSTGNPPEGNEQGAGEQFP